MSRICDSCGKGSQKAANRSHSNVKTLRRQMANLQKVGNERHCTRCIRAKKFVAGKMQKNTV